MPVRTSVDVANRSLDMIGTSTLGAITDTTPEGLICSRNYNICRQAVLRMHPWNFAMSRKILTITNDQNPVAPSFDYLYSLYLPLDYLRLTNVMDSAGIDVLNFADWQLEGKCVLTNTDTLWIRYVKDAIDVDDFDPVFFNCLALNLAWVISYKLTQSNTLKDQLWKDFLAAVSKAKFVDSIENPGLSIDNDVWMRSRLGPSQGFVRDPQT